MIVASIWKDQEVDNSFQYFLKMTSAKGRQRSFIIVLAR